MQLLHLVFIIFAATTTTYILMATIPLVHCGEYDQVINCTDGCLVPFSAWHYEISISTHWKCPGECICILGNWNVTLTCPNGTSLLQILYPPSWIIALSWSDTGIHGMEINAFATGFTNLFWLYLANNNIVKLHPEQFVGLTNLDELDLSNNDIVELHPHQFVGLRNLWRLDLSNNEIMEMHPQQFAGLPSMVGKLDLSNNDIVELHPEQFVGIKFLEELDLSNNDIVELHRQPLKIFVYICWTCQTITLM